LSAISMAACELFCAPGATESAGIGFKASVLSLCSADSALVASKHEVVKHSWTLPESSTSAESAGTLSCPAELHGLLTEPVVTLPKSFVATEIVHTHGIVPGAFAVASACGKVWLGAPGSTAATHELGHASVADASAGPSDTLLSPAAGGVFAAAHSGSKRACLLSLPSAGSLALQQPFATALPNTATCVAAIHAPSMANAPILAAGHAQAGCIWDSRAPGATQQRAHAAAAAAISPTSGQLVHMRWCGEWGVTGGLVTMSTTGIVELWEPRTWRVAEQWRAPAKYSTRRLAVSDDAKYVWSAGTDNDILGGQLALGELGVPTSQGSWKVSRGGAGVGREVNKGGYTGPEAGVDNTPDRIKEGRRKGFHGGARWVGMDATLGGAAAAAAASAAAGQHSEFTLAALTEKGQLYIVRNAQLMG